MVLVLRGHYCVIHPGGDISVLVPVIPYLDGYSYLTEIESHVRYRSHVTSTAPLCLCSEEPESVGRAADERLRTAAGVPAWQL